MSESRDGWKETTDALASCQAELTRLQAALDAAEASRQHLQSRVEGQAAEIAAWKQQCRAAGDKIRAAEKRAGEAELNDSKLREGMAELQQVWATEKLRAEAAERALAAAQAENKRLLKQTPLEMFNLENAREDVAAWDGPEGLYTEEMVDSLLFAAEKDFEILKGQIRWLERNSVLRNPAQQTIYDRIQAAEHRLADANAKLDNLHESALSISRTCFKAIAAKDTAEARVVALERQMLSRDLWIVAHDLWHDFVSDVAEYDDKARAALQASRKSSSG
jgi:hypothetical protein